jgi:hypothetical protein
MPIEGMGRTLLNLEEHIDLLKAGHGKEVKINERWVKKNWHDILGLRDSFYGFADRTASPLFVINPEAAKADMRRATKILKKLGF